MAGPFHDFFVLPLAEHPFSAYTRFINDPGAVRLHDDLIGYLWDSLVWIRSYNPARGEPENGLCRWGPTVIHIEGAVTARGVFTAWADLFSAGPSLLRLTGEWACFEGRPPENGGYEPLEFDRDEIVGRLRILAGYFERVARAGGDLYVLHLGI